MGYSVIVAVMMGIFSILGAKNVEAQGSYFRLAACSQDYINIDGCPSHSKVFLRGYTQYYFKAVSSGARIELKCYRRYQTPIYKSYSISIVGQFGYREPLDCEIVARNKDVIYRSYPF